MHIKMCLLLLKSYSLHYFYILINIIYIPELFYSLIIHLIYQSDSEDFTF